MSQVDLLIPSFFEHEHGVHVAVPRVQMEGLEYMLYAQMTHLQPNLLRPLAISNQGRVIPRPNPPLTKVVVQVGIGQSRVGCIWRVIAP